MNLCIDQGNSSVKLAVYDGDKLISEYQFDVLTTDVLSKIKAENPVEQCILSTVKEIGSDVMAFLSSNFERFIALNHLTPIPVINKYATPETLGKDRLAAVIGAYSIMPGQDLLIIDAGTAITYDFVNAAGEYLGGNISPGPELRFRALNEFTGKLPLVQINSEADVLGNTTETAIQSGVYQGILAEINGVIALLKVKYPKLSVFLTGGGAIYFENRLKYPIFTNKNLVLTGLNHILLYNA